MKKVSILIIGLYFLSILPAQAVKLGIKAGVNLSEASFSRDVLYPENFTGFQAGPIIEFNLPLIGLGMDAAILYSLEGFKLDKQTKKTGSIDIPLNLKMKYGLLEVFDIYGSAGPYINVKVSGDNFSILDIPNEFKYKTFGAGLNFGFGVELFSHLQVGANYQLKLTDDYSTGYYNVKTKTWSIIAAYFF